MMGRQDAQEQLFCSFRLEDPVPGDHLLRQLDAVLKVDKVREELADHYSATGWPSIDPELMLRTLFDRLRVWDSLGTPAVQRGTPQPRVSLVLPFGSSRCRAEPFDLLEESLWPV